MHLTITTPEKVLIDDEVDSVGAPTTTGHITILPHHINLLTQLESGEMIIRKNGREQYVGITGGFLEMKKNVVSVLADYAVHSESIVVEKTIAAQKRADEILKKSKDDVTERDFAIAQLDMRRSIMELKVANRRRSSR